MEKLTAVFSVLDTQYQLVKLLDFNASVLLFFSLESRAQHKRKTSRKALSGSVGGNVIMIKWKFDMQIALFSSVSRQAFLIPRRGCYSTPI